VMMEGSPPSARGIPRSLNRTGSFHRITPERAGNTTLRASRASLALDHPRARGEYLISGLSPLRVVGSPPSARGILRRGVFGR